MRTHQNLAPAGAKTINVRIRTRMLEPLFEWNVRAEVAKLPQHVCVCVGGDSLLMTDQERKFLNHCIFGAQFRLRKIKTHGRQAPAGRKARHFTHVCIKI